MSHKKLVFALVTSLTISYMTSVTAWGYHDKQPSWMLINQNAEQPPVTWYHPNFYFSGSVGWAWVDWHDFGFPDSITDQLFAPGTPLHFDSNDDGVVYGFLTGLQFAPHFAVEMGGYDLFNGDRLIENSEKDEDSGAVKSFKDDSSSYFIYGALKLILPLYQRFDIYGKIGPVYRHIGNSSECNITTGNDTTDCPENPISFSNGSYWSVFLALGAEFDLTQNIALGAQWFYVPENDDSNFDDSAPAINAAVLVLSYRILNL